MTFSIYGYNRSYRLGPATNTFEGTDLSSAEASRDSFFQANPNVLASYDSNRYYMIRLTYAGNTVAMTRDNGQWVNYTAFVQGMPGEVASLDNVPVMQIPYKLADGTFAGSGARMLDNGSIPSASGFGVQSGSVAFGDVLTLSESAGFLAITNHLDGNNYTLVDHASPRTGGSSDPKFFKLDAAEFTFPANADKSQTLTTNPLIFQYATKNTARTNALIFSPTAAMSNVRIRITQMSNGVALKYIPNKTTWEVGTGGLEWTAGDQMFDFEDTPLILTAGQQLQFEIRATTISLAGSSTGSPAMEGVIQTGVFHTLISDQTYTAADVAAKLASLSGTDRISVGSVQGSVTSVAGRNGDVLLSASDVSGFATVATTGAYGSLTGLPYIPVKISDLTNDSSFITAGQSPIQTVNGQTGTVVITATTLGLGNVSNVADNDKPVSSSQQAAIDLKMVQHLADPDPHPQYTTTARAIAAAPVQSVNGKTGTVTLTTGAISEFGNLYYTDARVQAFLTTALYNVKSLANAGSGALVVRDTTSGTSTLRSILGTGAITVTQNANDITINAPVVTLPTKVSQLTNDSAYLTKADTLTVFNSAGKVSSPKIWYGTATVDANAKWTVDYSSAGFTVPPQITATAVLNAATTTPSDRAWATVETGGTTTSATGYVIRGIVLSILGATVRIGPTGTIVQVTAIGI